ncbi:cysteine hydrolase family protein [Microbaculum sp. FT89]|uniref:cysteine hydrolase family protein n=1 Tax=Microbaculum sp. FT89 TaxID=3447298 RepID=UPI003F53399D
MDAFSAKRSGQTGMDIVPENTAVLIVDMLRDFCDPAGAMPLGGADRLYPIQNGIVSTARSAGAMIGWVVDAHRPGLRRDREFLKRTPHCIEGTAGVDVMPQLDRQPEDFTFLKRRFSAFFATDLDLTLKDNLIDTVIVFGVVTNICVRSTVHDAFFNGYRVIVPHDACAATGPREQASSLYDIATHFGTVTDAAAVQAAFRDGALITSLPEFETN